MESCNACKGPKRDPRYRACAKCREGWRLDKGLSYQKKTVPVESYQKAIEAAYAEGFKAGQEAMQRHAQNANIQAFTDGGSLTEMNAAIRALPIEVRQS